MDYETFLKEKDENYVISEKTGIYILNLLKRYTQQLYHPETYLNMTFMELLEDAIKILNIEEGITEKGISASIKFMRGKIRINKKEIKKIQEFFSFRDFFNEKEIKRILCITDTESLNLSSLTLQQYRRLIKTPNRFFFIPKEMPILCTLDLEIGYQLSPLFEDNKMKYLKFFNILMLDYDNISYNELKRLLEEKSKEYIRFWKMVGMKVGLIFEIYQTFNGFHVFEISRFWDHKKEETINFMKLFCCDQFYILFIKKFGFKIRLNSKKGRIEDFLYKRICRMSFCTDCSGINEEVFRFLAIHDKLGIKSENFIPSLIGKEKILYQRDKFEGFYGSFAKDLLDPYFIETREKKSIKKLDPFTDSKYRQYLFKKTPKEERANLIETFSKSSFMEKILKPQRLIVNEEDYYVAIDMLTNTYYICYKNLMMIDLDDYKGNSQRGNSQRDLDTTLCDGNYYEVYRSQGGLHVFCLSEEKFHKDMKNILSMLDKECDFYYALYSYIRGYCVRLNTKEKESWKNPSIHLYDFEKSFGLEIVRNENLKNLCDLHLELSSKVFVDVGFSKMFGG